MYPYVKLMPVCACFSGKRQAHKKAERPLLVEPRFIIKICICESSHDTLNTVA